MSSASIAMTSRADLGTRVPARVAKEHWVATDIFFLKREIIRDTESAFAPTDPASFTRYLQVRVKTFKPFSTASSDVDAMRIHF